MVKKVILIAEDELTNLRLVCDLLRLYGYITIETVNGKQCIELARTKKPDLIVMDIMMPEMDGFEATRSLKADATTQNIPILALTAYAMKGDKERVLQAGCDGYLAKPFDVKKLLEKVAEYLSIKGQVHPTSRLKPHEASATKKYTASDRSSLTLKKGR